jgi:ABC-type sugar transport system ATPase subunit
MSAWITGTVSRPSTSNFCSIGQPDMTYVVPRRAAMVSRNFNIFPNMTGCENIAIPLQVLRRDIDCRVEKAAEVVGIGHLPKRSSLHVSKSEVQGTMVLRPEVFVMDEPH